MPSSGQRCPFKHGEDKDATLSTEEHIAIINYAEANKKEAHAVTLSEVISNGGINKWKGAAKLAWQQKRMFPVLQKRQTDSRCVYKQAVDYI